MMLSESQKASFDALMQEKLLMSESKVVVITGASSGIGEATARLLAKQGNAVVLGARREGKLKKVVSEIVSDGGTAVYCVAAASKVSKQEALARKAIETYGRIDVWVNNAGLMPLSLLSEDKVEDWDRCVDVNLKGVLYGIHACLGIMRAQRSGHIVNIGSLSSHQTGLTCGVYAATKFGVRAISETLREEEAAAGSGIRVTMLAPGMIATELPQSLTTQEGRDGMQAAYDALAIPAESVAQSVAFAVNMPENTAINEIIIRPTAQRL